MTVTVSMHGETEAQRHYLIYPTSEGHPDRSRIPTQFIHMASEVTLYHKVLVEGGRYQEFTLYSERQSYNKYR